MMICSVSYSRWFNSTFSLSRYFAPPTPLYYSQHGFSILCSWVSSLLLSCPTSYHLFLGFAKHFPKTTNIRTIMVNSRISRVPHKRHPYMHQVYDSGESTNGLTLTSNGYFAFPFRQQGQHSQFVISELNTEPALSSVNA
jgi:hypothetical protein